MLVAVDVRDGAKADEVPLGANHGEQMAIIGPALYLWGPERDFAAYSAEDIAPIQRPDPHTWQTPQSPGSPCSAHGDAFCDPDALQSGDPLP